MKIKPLLVVTSVAIAVALGAIAQRAEARGFGNRGGVTIRIGVGRRATTNRQYFGPRFYTAPRIGNPNVGGSSQYQLRQWYYSRSGPFEYYRPERR